jgi:hypothetical protein
MRRSFQVAQDVVEKEVGIGESSIFFRPRVTYVDLAIIEDHDLVNTEHSAGTGDVAS